MKKGIILFCIALTLLVVGTVMANRQYGQQDVGEAETQDCDCELLQNQIIAMNNEIEILNQELGTCWVTVFELEDELEECRNE